jgi:predicted AlkP superfamily phosphohydrolase/phosphomutase
VGIGIEGAWGPRRLKPFVISGPSCDKVPEASAIRKVIAIGLDGLDPGIVEHLLKAGELPNLAKLASLGGHSRVATTYPAQTPVAWSTFATGLNPGGHGIFDFIRPDRATYRPRIALNGFERKNAFTSPKAVNLRRGAPVWEWLGKAGVGSVVLRCPCTFPAEPVRGRMLSGMGVPDLRGGFGSPTFFTTAKEVAAKESETVTVIRDDGKGVIETHLEGPRAGAGRPPLRCEIRLILDRPGQRVVLSTPGTSGESEVRLGQWSRWHGVRFNPGPFQSIRGIVRFHLVRLEPEIELYASPIDFDPESPLFPISHPADYSSQLVSYLGPFATAGMVEEHTGLMNGRIDEAAFLEQCELVWSEREAMMRLELDRFEEGFFYCLFDTPDRVQHMFWRFREPDHPANRGVPPRPELARVIDDQYRRADEVVGEVLDYADDETLVIALSDHGFCSFRRGVHLNSWLLEKGLLCLKPGLRPGPEAGDLLQGIDWSRTRAYSVGLGGIDINLKGREALGIVNADEVDALKAMIADGLTGLVDPESGAVAIRRVLSREQIYSGTYAHEAPDLSVAFSRGYRVSWGSSMGGVPEGLVEDNLSKWSGDHVVDPALVPGVLFMNRPYRTDAASLVDLAPTILEALGCPAPPSMEGNSLLS